ncbi:hypothetical protein [Microbacterium sp. TPD7012]|uniref:hypothetical protein n=1 Tax=Microbacterium sp. TPD7012 TaxID=2171975 RepID=UPI0010570E96|nr:hypothetical protein [Microbacterium sp. TPD7012]
MSDDTPGDEIRALESADPAAAATASADLHDRISRIPTATTPVPAGRGRPRWLVPLAASAAVAAAIGGAYIWGSGGIAVSPSTTPIAVETGTPADPARPIHLYGDGSGGALSQSVEMQVGGRVEPSVGVGFGWDRPTGRNRFLLPTLDTASTQADVFVVDPAAQTTAEDAGRMAAALGLSGDARPSDLDGGWVVGDYAGAYFGLQLWGEAYFQSGIPDALSVCERSATDLHGRDKMNDDGTWAFGQEMIRCMADTPPPSDELVQESVSLFLSALGIDETATQITLTPDGSDHTTTATAALIVENNVTEIVARVTVSAQGIMYASGPTGEIVSLGSYAVVSPAEAGERLSDPAFSARMVSSPDYLSVPPASLTAPPEAPQPGSAVPWKVVDREIVSVRLGLALLPKDVNQHRYLVPTYEFTAADGTVWSVIALGEDELDMTGSG